MGGDVAIGLDGDVAFGVRQRAPVDAGLTRSVQPVLRGADVVALVEHVGGLADAVVTDRRAHVEHAIDADARGEVPVVEVDVDRAAGELVDRVEDGVVDDVEHGAGDAERRRVDDRAHRADHVAGVGGDVADRVHGGVGDLGRRVPRRLGNRRRGVPRLVGDVAQSILEPSEGHAANVRISAPPDIGRDPQTRSRSRPRMR